MILLNACLPPSGSLEFIQMSLPLNFPPIIRLGQSCPKPREVFPLAAAGFGAGPAQTLAICPLLSQGRGQVCTGASWLPSIATAATVVTQATQYSHSWDAAGARGTLARGGACGGAGGKGEDLKLYRSWGFHQGNLQK